MSKVAVVTGILGQDGAYLAQLLLQEGYKVIGGVRRSSTRNLWRLDELGITDRLDFIDLDLHEFSNIIEVVRLTKPSAFFNLGAQSFVGASFLQPILTADVDAIAVLRILEAIRLFSPETRFYQASTSEMFGKAQSIPQSEQTPFYPRSPYGVSKLFAHWITVNYREAYGLRASSGILFNHESPLRGLEFVTRKITATFAQIAHGKDITLELGNLDAKRDWGHARDYVRGMFAMTQHAVADDFVLATGETCSVRDFVRLASAALGFELEFEGVGVEELARDKKSGKILVKVNPQFFRPTEVSLLIGDSSKAKQILGWTPDVSLDALAEEMVKADFDRAKHGRIM